MPTLHPIFPASSPRSAPVRRWRVWPAVVALGCGLLGLGGLPLVRAQEVQGGAAMSEGPARDRLRTQGLAPLPQNLFGRNRTDLSGYWRFLVDSVERGLRNQYPRYTIPKDEQQAPVGGRLVEYDWPSAPEISVPGDWNTQANERLFWYEGLGWYRRRFSRADVPAGARLFLYFEAANYRSHVYLNGEPLGVHEGGFTPFAFEITGKLVDDNSLVVGVNSKRQHGNIPGSDADWFNYGGLTRPVWLVAVPDTFVQHYQVALVDGTAADGGPHLRLDVVLDGPHRAHQSVAIRIAELNWQITLTTDAEGRARAMVAAPPQLVRWSPKAPRLYELTVQSAHDQVTERLGFRTIATRGTEVLLNGQPIFLRGISIHEERLGDQADDGGRKLDWDDARRLLQEAQDLGCNFVRLAHYPHSERMTRLADEMGLLVWSEIPVYQEDIPYDDPEALATARRMQAANIARDANRASVIVWSVANETPLTPERLAFLKALIGDARAQDGTRLISAALNRGLSNTDFEIVIDDPLGHELDLLAYNTYIGWYGRLSPADITRVQWRNTFGKPMIFSEFGTDAKYGTRGLRESRWTEEYQAWFYEQTLANLETIPWVQGVSPWILKDFRSPRRYRTDYQNYWNRKGLIAETGQRKLAWFVLRDFFSKKQAATEAQP